MLKRNCVVCLFSCAELVGVRSDQGPPESIPPQRKTQLRNTYFSATFGVPGWARVILWKVHISEVPSEVGVGIPHARKDIVIEVSGNLSSLFSVYNSSSEQQRKSCRNGRR